MTLIKNITLYIFLLFCYLNASVQAIALKDTKPFEKKLVFLKFILEETGDSTSNFPLDKPISCAQDTEGNIYILDSGNHCVVKYNSNGKYIRHWGKKGQGPKEFIFRDGGDPIYISDKNIIYIGEGYLSRIQVYDSEGKLLNSFRTERPPDSICVDSGGRIFVSHALGSKNDDLIYIYNSKGEKLRSFGEPLVRTERNIFNESYLTKDDDNYLYQVFRFLPILRKYSSSGDLIFEKKIDLRKCKMIEKTAIFWNNYILDQSADSHRSFAKGIFFYKSNLYISLFDTYVLSKNGEVVGLYKYDPELGYIMLPRHTIRDRITQKLLLIISEKDRVGAALFDL